MCVFESLAIGKVVNAAAVSKYSCSLLYVNGKTHSDIPAPILPFFPAKWCDSSICQHLQYVSLHVTMFACAHYPTWQLSENGRCSIRL